VSASKGFFMDNDEDQSLLANLSPMGKLKNFLSSSRRVLIISKKPSKDEFMAMMKVTAIGIIIIGVIGAIVQLIFVFTGIGFTKLI